MCPIAATPQAPARPVPAAALGRPSEPAPQTPPEQCRDAGRRVSEETYWTHYYLESDIHYEWNNGLLEEKPVSDYETWLVYAWFVQLLQHFLIERPIARTVALEMGFRLALPGGVAVRRPDLGVVHNDNRQPLLPLDRSYHGIFDICIEALSDSERAAIERDLTVKKAEYAAAGVPEYYILHREPELQAFFARTDAGLYMPIAPQDGIIRSRVLPGLQFRLTDLCERPELKAMRKDPVYAEFVLPEWREAELRAELETQRAQALDHARQQAERRVQELEQACQQAEQRAQAQEQARQQAEQELAKLRALIADRRPEP